MRRYILLLFIGLVWGDSGQHSFFTPYISPGIQIGYNDNKTLFISCQLTLGTSFKVTKEKHFVLALRLRKKNILKIHFLFFWGEHLE